MEKRKPSSVSRYYRVPEAEITGNLVEAYHRLLMNPIQPYTEGRARLVRI
jgi:hypothetical protein